MIRFFSLLLFLLTATVAKAQTVYSGRVADAEGKAVARASVMLRGEKGRTVAFGTTNSEGRFSVKLPEGRVAKDVAVNHIGFAQVVIAIDKFKNGQTITMRDKPVEIREVTVKPEEIRLEGDTLTYNVAGFKQKQDKYIEDVIARLPGVSVTLQGKIMYQGKEINKFYVEGMDLMGSKYAQVSRNLTADKVKNVQVYENHQPVKMQRGVTFSEQAAMNLQLKDEAKNVWTGVIDAGTGLTLQGKTDWLRDGRWVEMFFGRKKQSLSMYKTNNTGKDITMEVRTAGSATAGLINNLANRSGERNTFNDTHILATNWLFKTGADSELRLQVAGLRDKIKTQSYSETRYNDIDGQVLITEEQSRTARQDQWNAEVQYMGYKVTLIVHVKERYEFPVEHPEEIKKLETAEGVDMILEGDWNPEFGGMEVASGQSTLNMKIYDYVEAGKSQYAWGTLGDGDTDIGEVVMIRP